MKTQKIKREKNKEGAENRKKTVRKTRNKRKHKKTTTVNREGTGEKRKKR